MSAPPISTEIIPILEDNYAYLVTYTPGYAFLVDPADPPLVLEFLQSLPTPPVITHILTTHKHWDHAGGNKKIVEALTPTQPSNPISVVCGALESHATTTLPCSDNDAIALGPHSVTCMHTPAHTNGHMCYYVGTAEPPVVFTGDCMFKGGCGKFFEVREGGRAASCGRGETVGGEVEGRGGWSRVVGDDAEVGGEALVAKVREAKDKGLHNK
ncbi:hypothetical protein TrRE_jg10251 [Triparma retinervis]|uniref:hydroxyacylglutathione hydrolase n=1 Tax=Triparma retinervis TaxID=2557542 RepID=A0A9W7A6P8_9STRA|nr:hypothetical protein TrRE_jg10251 [Triparma retinervis]